MSAFMPYLHVNQVVDLSAIKVQPEPAEEAWRLLVIDDDARLRALLQRYLSANGFRVSAAADAAEARALMKSMAFDCLTLDVTAPVALAKGAGKARQDPSRRSDRRGVQGLGIGLGHGHGHGDPRSPPAIDRAASSRNSASGDRSHSTIFSGSSPHAISARTSAFWTSPDFSFRSA